ncbi:MAG: AzlD domain-containing protein [Spirochaetaceae bacterium]|jgi:branched-subunit amino acid transport protein AzlD|nr:AzlD domain-containing protein [Spirochaetaceae bacterium]
MGLSTGEALVYTLVMAAVILFCRAFPFLFFRNRGLGAGRGLSGSFLRMVERVVPPVAMTVLAFNAISGALKDPAAAPVPVLAASAFTALVHLWKRNALISIIGGTVVYMILTRLT